MKAFEPRRVIMSLGRQTQRNSDPAQARRVPPASSGLAAPQGGAKAKIPPGRTWSWLFGVLLVNYLLVRHLMPGPEAPITVPYTLFKEEVAKGNVEASCVPRFRAGRHLYNKE